MSAAEPTNAEIMTVLLRQTEVIAAQGVVLQSHSARFDAIDKRFDTLETKVDTLTVKVDQIAEDVVGIKVNQALIEQHIDDFQTWARRHEANHNNPQDRAA